jgi:hypothetical protein
MVPERCRRSADAPFSYAGVTYQELERQQRRIVLYILNTSVLGVRDE